ncbi:hypothetical protein MRB53_031175 [Persea americana]|uniref:Uncharacterized protein n=1 Tax=Persea americana TaxID=3435 RepID=A0ACC2KN93_PERAE|nr:hypothetical protein MRB53_031175 [Persea americana]
MALEGGGGLDQQQQLLLNNDNENENSSRRNRTSSAFLYRSKSHAADELRSFRSWMRWMCVDQSTAWQTFLSWAMFVALAVCVPVLSHFILSCPTCDARHQRPYDMVVQLSLTVIATLSFCCLSRFIKKYGLRSFLFLDKLCHESEEVRHGYTDQLNRSFKILSYFVLPCFIAESTYKIWWYCSGGSRIPFLENVYLSNAIACILELCSWLYRTSIFFLVCVLFHLICHLQILRLQDFTQVIFREESDVAMVLKEHLRIRRQLKVISHRFRAFIMSTLIFVTASQFAALLITTRSHADANIFKAGELALCSMGLVTGLFICLRSATKITHKAQAITNHAAKWHVCATIDSYDTTDCETPMQITSCPQVFPIYIDSEEEAMDGDDVDDTKFVPPQAHTISFQKRQALVTYFENNRAGITVFGFMLDRTWIHTIFGIELSLVLWLLGKTVGIS